MPRQNTDSKNKELSVGDQKVDSIPSGEAIFPDMHDQIGILRTAIQMLQENIEEV